MRRSCHACLRSVLSTADGNISDASASSKLACYGFGAFQTPSANLHRLWRCAAASKENSPATRTEAQICSYRANLHSNAIFATTRLSRCLANWYNECLNIQRAPMDYNVMFVHRHWAASPHDSCQYTIYWRKHLFPVFTVAGAAYLDVGKGIGQAGSASEAEQDGVAAPSQQHLHIASKHAVNLQDPTGIRVTDPVEMDCWC